MKTSCRRIPISQIEIINFIAEEKEQSFPIVIKNIINSSPIFKEYQKKYELAQSG